MFYSDLEKKIPEDPRVYQSYSEYEDEEDL